MPAAAGKLRFAQHDSPLSMTPARDGFGGKSLPHARPARGAPAREPSNGKDWVSLNFNLPDGRQAFCVTVKEIQTDPVRRWSWRDGRGMPAAAGKLRFAQHDMGGDGLMRLTF